MKTALVIYALFESIYLALKSAEMALDGHTALAIAYVLTIPVMIAGVMWTWRKIAEVESL